MFNRDELGGAKIIRELTARSLEAVAKDGRAGENWRNSAVNVPLVLGTVRPRLLGINGRWAVDNNPLAGFKMPIMYSILSRFYRLIFREVLSNDGCR
ncbi:MAG: hypothetical protein HRU05_08325 [Oceanospirillaceae bacterium]|nr:hypothetical protein [Oceanospirillaceae bacterium]